MKNRGPHEEKHGPERGRRRRRLRAL